MYVCTFNEPSHKFIFRISATADISPSSVHSRRVIDSYQRNVLLFQLSDRTIFAHFIYSRRHAACVYPFRIERTLSIRACWINHRYTVLRNGARRCHSEGYLDGRRVLIQPCVSRTEHVDSVYTRSFLVSLAAGGWKLPIRYANSHGDH